MITSSTATFLCLIFLSTTQVLVLPSSVNITIAYLTERSSTFDLPTMYNRTIGLVAIAYNKAREIVEHSVNLNLVTSTADVPGCTALEWGALAAEVYHSHEIHAIIGFGKCTFLYHSS